MTRVAVVGAGWAGAAAALTLARAGVATTVFEATQSAGGRARRVERDGRCFDNGQHLLLGAYERSLALIASVHNASDSVLQRLPLSLQTAPGITPELRILADAGVPAPLHLLLALAKARGLTVTERLATIAWAARALLHTGNGDGIDAEMTVAELISSQPATVRDRLWSPLCVAALNTPSEAASARVFVDVLRQSFMGHAAASDLIIPLTDLSALFPQPALREVCERGGELRLGAPAVKIDVEGPGASGVVSGAKVLTTDGTAHRFDAVVLAVGPQHVPRLLADTPAAAELVTALQSLRYEPITTLHFEFTCVSPGVDERMPMLMLDGSPGEWLFWRRLGNGRWRASVVISAHHRDDGESALETQTLSQLRRSYALPAPVWQICVTEKRATYACTPAQSRSLHSLPHRFGAVHLAGDWCIPRLPATLEAAIISGETAAQHILENMRT